MSVSELNSKTTIMKPIFIDKPTINRWYCVSQNIGTFRIY